MDEAPLVAGEALLLSGKPSTTAVSLDLLQLLPVSKGVVAVSMMRDALADVQQQHRCCLHLWTKELAIQEICCQAHKSQSRQAEAQDLVSCHLTHVICHEFS